MLDNTLSIIRKFIPKKVYTFFQPAYHYILAFSSALFYNFPSKKIKIIGVTGTKGKSSTVEIINAILEKAGYKTALSNTIRYKIADESFPNKFKMSMPGRFFVQKFIRNAIKKGCDYIVLEMTSQGVLQYRHKFIDLNALVFTNLSPEHIESHGSYEKYVEAKLEIAKELSNSSKRPRIVITNADDKEGYKFHNFNAEIKKSYSLKGINISTPLQGEFNKYNVLAAITLAKELGIKDETINEAVSNLKEIPGRVEYIKAGQKFNVIVDYAHTPDSLSKLYKVFERKEGQKNICVLGGTGGGRDNWKRKEMGKIAEMNCDEIILTNEDPYDEDPEQIVRDVASGIQSIKPLIIMDRRQAINKAISLASDSDNVIITGKGTDPYIMGPNGTKISWSDTEIAREEILKII